MKKFIKYILICILAFLLLFIINRLYTTNIMYKTYKTMLSKANEDNFYSKITTTNQTVTSNLETWIKNGIYKKVVTHETEDNVKRSLTFWEHNKSPNEKNKFYLIIKVDDKIVHVEEKDVDYQVEPNNKWYKYNYAQSLVVGDGKLIYLEDEKEYSFLDIFVNNLKNLRTNASIISDKDNCYKLLYSGAYIYINKDTNLPIISIAPDNTGITTYEYFTKDVTDEDLKEPDISEYTIQEN